MTEPIDAATASAAVPTPAHPLWLRHQELLGRLVLDRETAEDRGQVAELWFDPRQHQIVGIACRSGLLGVHQQAFRWSEIETIGAESILISQPLGATFERPDTALSTLGQGIWTDTGQRVGVLVDYRFDPETGDIADYLFSPTGWRGITEGLYCLPAAVMVSMSRRQMIVTEAGAQAAAIFTPGLKDNLAGIAAYLQADYAQTQTDVQTVVQSTQSIAHRLKGSLSSVADQLQQATEQVKDRIQVREIGRSHPDPAEPASTAPNELEAETITVEAVPLSADAEPGVDNLTNTEAAEATPDRPDL